MIDAAAEAAGERHRHSRTRHILSLLIVATLVGAGCGASPTVIAADAEPIVNRILAADPIEGWTFTYQPDTASPYLACLGGIDEVQGVIDLGDNLLRLKPNRDAPPVIVTNTAVLVPDPSEPQRWLEIAWTPTLDPALLSRSFGEVMAGYIATGLRAPDLNMSTQAVIDIASSVEATDPPLQLTGDAIRITVDPDRYLRELEANDADISDDERDQVPTVTAVVDALGRVSALVVDTAPSQPDKADAGHGNRSIVTARFDDLGPISAPRGEDREPATFADVSYPSPEASCEFGR